MSTDPLDALTAYEAAVSADAEALRQFNALTRSLFDNPRGHKWLTLAMAKFNFMGGVFDESFNPQAAAHRDGVRAVLSEILNAMAAGRKEVPTTPADDE